MEVNAKGKVHPKTVYEGLEGEHRYSSTVSLTSALDAGGWLTPRHWPLNPRERDPVPIVQEAGWAPGPVWMGSAPGFDHWTIQPPASHYTDFTVMKFRDSKGRSISCDP